MNIIQRFRAAWQIAPEITKPIDTGQKAAAALRIEDWRGQQPEYPEINFETMVRDGWRKNELIFACISKKANTASQVALEIRQKRNDRVFDDHPAKALIQAPNPFMSEFDFWSAVIIYQDLAGRAIFEKERSRRGVPVRLWPLRPDWVSVVPSGSTMIGAYKYSPPGLTPQLLDPADVLDFRLFDPINQYNTWPPVAVAARVGDVDNSATDFVKLTFQKGGTPQGILKTVQKLNDASVEDIRRRWRARYGGYENWIDPAVLDSDAEYQRTGMTFEEMGFEKLDARNEARICMILKVPPILVGANIGLARSTYSNYREARSAWWEDDLIPLYHNHADVLENQLLTDFDKTRQVYAGWNLDGVPAVQEQMTEQRKEATEEFKTGAITVNEYREKIGLKRIGPAGEVFLRSMATVEVPAKGERPKPEPEPVPEPQSEEPPEMMQDEGGENAGEMDEMDNGEGEKSITPAEAVKADKPDDARARRDREKEIEAAMEAYFQAELRRIKKEVSKNGKALPENV